MRIVLLNPKRVERDAMVRALAHSTYRVEPVGDEPTALAAIARESPAVIVFSVPAAGAPDLVRRLRATDSTGQAYLLALLESTASRKDIASVLDAGVHDFIRRPIVDAELVERVRAPARLIRWAQSLPRTTVFDLASAMDIGRLQAWKNLGTLVADDLSQIATQAFAVREGWPKRFADQLCGATIPMSLAGDQLEVRVSIVVDALTLHWLRGALLGDPNANADATDDALRELANTAGGAVKRAALCENVTLTTGLPSTNHSPSFSGDRVCWTLSSDGGDVCIAVVGEIRKLANQRVPASELSEGMVLAHDIRNASGILLVPAGSRLTGTSAAKLSAMLGPRFLIEVAPVA